MKRKDREYVEDVAQMAVDIERNRGVPSTFTPLEEFMASVATDQGVEPAAHLRFETRPNDDGTVDEVLIYDGERCVFHVEQLTDDRYYLNWYGDADRRYFHIHRKGKHVVITED